MSDREQRNLTLALQLARRGWFVLPCQEKPPKIKTPYTAHGQTDATLNPRIIQSWWNRWPGAIPGIVLAKSGIFALDVDTHKDGENGYQTLENLILTYGDGKPLPFGPAQLTINGGMHRIFKLPTGLRIPGKLGPGLDVKSNGYICTGELSEEIYYEPLEGGDFEQDPPEPPAWLVKLFQERTRYTQII